MFEGRSHLNPSTQFESINKNAKLLKEKLSDKRLKPADIFLQTAEDFTEGAANHPEKAKRDIARKMFLQCIEYTNYCGCKHMTSLPGVYFAQESHEKSFERCCEELSWRCERAKEADIVFSIEVHIGSIVPSPEESLTLLNNVENLTLTLDYTHFIRMNIENSRINPLIKHASHFHARGGAPGKLQTSFKENMIDYANIIMIMKEQNYMGYICTEYTWQEWENCNRVDNVSESILLKDYITREFLKL